MERASGMHLSVRERHVHRQKPITHLKATHGKQRALKTKHIFTALAIPTQDDLEKVKVKGDPSSNSTHLQSPGPG